MILKKLIIAILSVVFLIGCSPAKSTQNSAFQQGEVSASVQVDKDKLIDGKIKEEKELKLKTEKEEKEKVQAEAKQKAEQEAKMQQQTVKPIGNPASAQLKPATQSNPSSVKPINSNHQVEYMGDVENEILVLVNQERAKIGAKPLVMNEILKSMARYKSNEMLQYGYFDHTSPNIGGISSLAKKFSYSYTALGENIWMAQSTSSSYLRQNTTAAKIMNGWMNSPGHKANILNPTYGKIGVGVTISSDGLSHATQEFSN